MRDAKAGALVMAWLAVLLLGIGAAGADGLLTNADVLRLTKVGVGDAVIAATVSAGGDAAKTGRRDSRGAERSGTPVAPGSVFRDRLGGGGEGPAMVVIPSGRFRMGCLSTDDDCWDWEKPAHDVTIGAAFALSVHEVTFEDYDRFTYPKKVDDRGWGRGRRPVILVSWNDAQDYVEWLSSQTGARYRLPSESEWEYAARAGTTTKYSWGNEIGVKRANCDGCGSDWDDKQTAPAGSFGANAFGLHDMHGNVREWVEDCTNEGYAGAPSDGSAWIAEDCTRRVLRGGSWYGYPRDLRAANRFGYPPGFRDDFSGFRVARALTP